MMRKSFLLSALGLMTACATACAITEIDDHLFSGSKFASEKNYKDAVREYKTAVSMDPQNAKANLLLGLALGFGLLLLPYALGGMGAGDVKALAALGALAACGGPELP